MKYLTLLYLLLLVQLSFAQQYEIRAVNIGDGKIAVQMRETSGNSPVAGSFLVDLMFGLKWDAAYDVDLSNTITTNYEIQRSDVRKLNGGFHFQAFYANNLPLAIPADWHNDWVEIMNIQNSLDGGQALGDFAICEFGFDKTTNFDININLIAYYLPTINGFAAAVVLPVELTDFRVKKSNTQSVLTWMTASEINTAYFGIERSMDGRYWSTIGTHQAIGNASTPAQYSFIDKKPMTANGFQKTVYYRLKMVDNDGQLEYSNIRSLDFEEKQAVTLYPNPTQQTIFIKQQRNKKSTIKIFTPNGKLLLTQEVPPTSSPFGIEVGQLPNGVYFLTNENGEMYKFVKTE